MRRSARRNAARAVPRGRRRGKERSDESQTKLHRPRPHERATEGAVMDKDRDRIATLEQERDDLEAVRVVQARNLSEGIARVAALEAEASEARKEVDRVRDLIVRDRTGLAAALNEVRRTLRGYDWIPSNEWGSYD